MSSPAPRQDAEVMLEQRVDDRAADDEIVANRASLDAMLGEAPCTFACRNDKPHSDLSACHAKMLTESGDEAAMSTGDFRPRRMSSGLARDYSH
jgi:hypothetical protein